MPQLSRSNVYRRIEQSFYARGCAMPACGEAPATKTPTGSAGAASGTPTAVGAFRAFGLTFEALPCVDSRWVS